MCNTFNGIAVLLPGLQVDYWSASYECWVPTAIRSVDQETGDVVVNTKKQPLSRQQARRLLRPRKQPGEKELQWVWNVLHHGNIESEAKRLFDEHADQGCKFLTRTPLKKIGETLDERLGVSGSSYELLRRAVKGAERGATGPLPDGWTKGRSETTGHVFFQKDNGQVQWEPPACAVALDQEQFQEAFWEMLVMVDQRWGQAFELKDKCIRQKAEMERDYAFGLRWKKLGSGTFGAVYLAKHRKTGIQRAVKVVPQKEVARCMVSRLENEIGRLQTLDHPHIVKLYDCYKGTENFYICMDFCSGGDLTKYQKKMKEEGKRMQENVLAGIMQQLLMAVGHVHAHGLLHLDIKPANVVVMPELRTMPPAHGPDPTNVVESDCNVHVMLIDLGLARIFRPGNFVGKEAVGTPATMAPEMWRGVETPAADIFSCGCTFFFLLADAYPFTPVPTNSKVANKFWADQPRRREFGKEVYSPLAYALCDNMLDQERLRRPTAKHCLRDNFFDQSWSENPQEGEHLERLAKAPNRSLLYRSVALSIAASWPAHRLPAIRQAFQDLDAKGTGRLQKAHIVQALQGLGVDGDVATKAAEAMDLSKDGIIDWTEFVAACISLGSDSMEKDLQELFKEADSDQDGFLDKQDIAKLLAMKHPSEEVVEKTMQQLLGDTTDPAGQVDWPTFRRHFNSVHKTRASMLRQQEN